MQLPRELVFKCTHLKIVVPVLALDVLQLSCICLSLHMCSLTNRRMEGQTAASLPLQCNRCDVVGVAAKSVLFARN